MVEKIKNRHPLKESEARKIKENLTKKFGEDFIGDSKIERGEIEENEFILIDGEPLLSKFGDQFFPNVKGALFFKLETNNLTVDQGAIPHVINGADVMAPGVVGVDEDLVENDLGVVIEEKHKKPIAIVKMLVEGKKIADMSEGKIAKNLHHVRDSLWEKIE